MKYEEWILIEEICRHYEVDPSFLEALNENEMIHLRIEQKQCYLPIEEISQFERMRRLHYEMNINMEGLGVIQSLMEDRARLKSEIQRLKNRLRIFE